MAFRHITRDYLRKTYARTWRIIQLFTNYYEKDCLHTDYLVSCIVFPGVRFCSEQHGIFLHCSAYGLNGEPYAKCFDFKNQELNFHIKISRHYIDDEVSDLHASA